MAYTPINWQTGDTITADKLNKMDNGWGVGSTQLFSETVTTAVGSSGNEASLSYASFIGADTVTVTFSGTDYECSCIIWGTNHFYGGFSTNPVGPDFTDYPFFIMSTGGGNTLYTETAGTYTVSVAVGAIETSVDFASAVQSVINQMSITPLWLEEGVTTYDETADAIDNNRIVCFTVGGGIRYVSSVVSNTVVFVPENAGFTAGFSESDDTFEITWL